HYPEFSGRYRGLVSALEDAGIAPDENLQFDALTTEEEGFSAARSLIESGKEFDAIFAASDLIAIGAMRALADAGRNVPEDVAIVGFDDIPAASMTTPPLTTVMQDIKRAGQVLVEALLAQIEGRDLPPRKLPGKLIVRGSSVTP
ncbi:MAG: substrate-binding domain-containing protein, partial [Erythrobacter sp.]|nr:substrate-binding domain-containing protein [Erythrobacter sp.]